MRRKKQSEGEKKRQKGMTVLQCFGLTFLLVFSGLLGGSMLLSQRMFSGTETINDVEFQPPVEELEEEFGTDNRVNVLLLGMNDNLADTIMVASFNVKEKHLDLISIPRDTYYERSNFYSSAAQKINSIYNTEKEDGMKKMAQAVSEVLNGMPLHYYMAVDYKGVANIVDSMGGVTFNVPFHMRYSDPTDKPPLYINIPAGEQVLDKDNVVEFLRFRKTNVRGYKGYPDGDEGRIRTQQEFMKAAFQQALDSNILKVAGSVLNNVDSDLSWGVAAKLAPKAMGMSAEDMSVWKLPGEARMAATKKDSTRLSFYFADKEGTTEMLDQIYNGIPEPAAGPEGSPQETAGGGVQDGV